MDEWSKKVGDKLKGYNYDRPFDEGKMQAFFDKREEDANPSKSPSRKWIMMAAAVSFLILATWGVHFSNGVTKTTQAGEIASVSLPDGSQVDLGYDSEISFNKLTWSWNRNVQLDGEAYFEVEKGSTFSVVSKNGITSVLGTKFNVYSRENGYTVECFEGRVKVDSGDQSIELAEDEGVDFTKRKKPTRYSVKRKTPDWKEGELYFSDEDISSVLIELERVYGVRIDGREKINSQKYSGYFPTDDLEMALRLVFEPVDVQYELNDKVVTIK